MSKKSVIKKSEAKFMARIPQAEITTAMVDLSATAFKLLMYYYSRNDGWEFKDENIAVTIDSTTRMVAKYRKELIDKEYLLIQKGQVDVYFVGKRAVAKFKEEISQEPDSYDEEPTEPIVSKPKITIDRSNAGEDHE